MPSHNSIRTPSYLPAVSPAIYLAIRFAISPDFWKNYLADYVLHSLTFSVSFLLLPLVVLRRSGNLGIFAGRRQFLVSFLAYVPLTAIFILLFDSTLGPAGEGMSLVLSVILVSLNVSSVDFYVFRVCGGVLPHLSPAITSTVWFLIHLPESLWLIDLGFGYTAVLSFMTLSGVFLSLVYCKTRDVSGLMAGHIFLNLVLAATR